MLSCSYLAHKQSLDHDEMTFLENDDQFCVKIKK